MDVSKFFFRGARVQLYGVPVMRLLMTTGRPLAFRIRVSDALRTAVREAMRHGRPQQTLALLAGFPSAQHFSQQLHAASFAATEKNFERWRALAAILNYSGEVFEDVVAEDVAEDVAG